MLICDCGERDQKDYMQRGKKAVLEVMEMLSHDCVGNYLVEFIYESSLKYKPVLINFIAYKLYFSKTYKK